VTTRGLKAKDMKQIAAFIDEAINHAGDDQALRDIGKKVTDMMSDYPLFKL
jgi:glycine hydroxymethyltransferase